MTFYILKTVHCASFLLEFAEKHVAAGSILRKISCYTWGHQELFFSCPSKVEVVVKNELYHVKQNPFKCIKNNYFCWKQSRQFVSFVVKKQVYKIYKHLSCCIFSHLSHRNTSHASVSQGERMIARLLIFSQTGLDIESKIIIIKQMKKPKPCIRLW